MRDYLYWYREKARLDKKLPPEFRAREIWWCALGANIGDEEDGKNKNFERPVLVLRKFNKSLFFGVPLTSRGKANKFYCSVSQGGDSFAMLSQARTMSSKRLLRRIYKVNEEDYERVCGKCEMLIFEMRNPQRAEDSRVPDGSFVSEATLELSASDVAIGQTGSLNFDQSRVPNGSVQFDDSKQKHKCQQTNNKREK